MEERGRRGEREGRREGRWQKGEGSGRKEQEKVDEGRGKGRGERAHERGALNKCREKREKGERCIRTIGRERREGRTMR